MTNSPEGSGLGDPRDVDRDGMIEKNIVPNASEISQDPNPSAPIAGEPFSAKEHIRKFQRILGLGPEVSSPIRGILDINHRNSSLIKGADGRPITPLLDFIELPHCEFSESSGFYETYSPSDRKREKTFDGSEYVKEAFGGFGPGSPEYDSEQRLKIVIPNSRAAVGWFKDTAANSDYTGIVRAAKKSFVANISDTRHPGVKTLEVCFTKSDTASLVTGKVGAQSDAFMGIAPIRDAEDILIDTKTPAKAAMVSHLRERLETLYPDKLKVSKDSMSAVIELGNDIDLHVDCTQLPLLRVTANGKYDRYEPIRYTVVKPTPRQLERELLALQIHFPRIAEAHADFFRQQLPKSQIEVDYNNPAESVAQDPIDPQRLAKLRQELITTPREDDFKYIGGLDRDIEKLREAALGFSHPEAFKEFGVTPPRGILLQGPPGTGKTSLANAFAREAGAVVLTLKASTIKSAFHGETERNIRGAFELADELVGEGEKVVIFIDEIESLAPARDSMGSSGIDKNVTTELLQGMNVDRPDCIIIAATNAPGLVDPALVNNSSRFSEQLEIGLPDTAARSDIIQKLFCKFADRSTSGEQGTLFDPDIKIDHLAGGSYGLSGADIENAIRKVLFTKAVLLVNTGQKPGPATSGVIYQSIKNMIAGKEKTGQNYL